MDNKVKLSCFQPTTTATKTRDQFLTEPYGVVKYSVFEAPSLRLFEQEAQGPEESEEPHPAAAPSRCFQELAPPPLALYRPATAPSPGPIPERGGRRPGGELHQVPGLQVSRDGGVNHSFINIMTISL